MYLLMFLPSSLALCVIFYSCAMAVYYICLGVYEYLTLACIIIGQEIGWSEYMEIKDVKFIIPARLPHDIVEVSVAKKFRKMIAGKTYQQIVLPEKIWLDDCSNLPIHHLLVNKSDARPLTRMNSPLYVYVEFDMLVPQQNRWFVQKKNFCCFYRLQGMSDPFVFPPHVSLKKKQPASKFLVRSSLILQHVVDNKLKRQFSCNVTHKLHGLAGPQKNFFVDTTAGNQLDQTFLFLLLREEISQLLEKAREQVVYERLDILETAEGRSSLKMSKNTHALVLKLRLQMNNNKIALIELDSYMPF